MASGDALLRVLRSAILGHTAEDVLRALRPKFPQPSLLLDLNDALNSIDRIRLVEDLDSLAALGLANFTEDEVVLTDAGADLADLLAEDLADVGRLDTVLTALLGWVEAAPRQSLGDFLGPSIEALDISPGEVARAVSYVVRQRLVESTTGPSEPGLALTDKGRLALHASVPVTVYVHRVEQISYARPDVES